MKEKLSRTQGSRYYPKRYSDSPEEKLAVLKEALYCTIGYTIGEQVFMIPTAFAIQDNTVYIHGSVGSHFMMHLSQGKQVCFLVSLMDALVLAKSVFNHSMNYRSVIGFGQTRLVDNEAEKLLALELITEHLIPGRWNDARQPSASELKKTSVIAITLEESSFKFRSHGVGDDPDDLHLPVWTGLIPIHKSYSAIQEETESKEIVLPEYIKSYTR